jgi:drug/metabolite transporter (DMT)-like permease
MLSFACAALAATGNATANVMQRKASLEQPAGTAFGPKLLADLVRRPTWLIGFAGMVGSFVLQAVALSLGQLSAVEPIITLEVPLTVMVASRVFNTRIGRGDWTGIWAMTAGMVVLVSALDPQPGDESDVSHSLYLMAGGSTAIFIGLLIFAAGRVPPRWRTGCLGAAAGTCFGLTATLIKGIVALLGAGGLQAMLSTWQTYAAVGVGISGVIIMQAALHAGPLLAAQPGFTLMDPLVSILWGVLVYQENTRTGAWLVLATLGGVAIGAGVALLARSPLLSPAEQDRPLEPGSTTRQ